MALFYQRVCLLVGPLLLVLSCLSVPTTSHAIATPKKPRSRPSTTNYYVYQHPSQHRNRGTGRYTAGQHARVAGWQRSPGYRENLSYGQSYGHRRHDQLQATAHQGSTKYVRLSNQHNPGPSTNQHGSQGYHQPNNHGAGSHTHGGPSFNLGQLLNFSQGNIHIPNINGTGFTIHVPHGQETFGTIYFPNEQRKNVHVHLGRVTHGDGSGHLDLPNEQRSGGHTHGPEFDLHFDTILTDHGHIHVPKTPGNKPNLSGLPPELRDLLNPTSQHTTKNQEGNLPPQHVTSDGHEQLKSGRPNGNLHIPHTHGPDGSHGPEFDSHFDTIQTEHGHIHVPKTPDNKPNPSYLPPPLRGILKPTAQHTTNQEGNLPPQHVTSDGHEQLTPTHTTNTGHEHLTPTHTTNTGHEHLTPTHTTNTGHEHLTPTHTTYTGHEHLTPTHTTNTGHEHLTPTHTTNTGHEHLTPTHTTTNGHANLTPPHTSNSGPETLIPPAQTIDQGPISQSEIGDEALVAHLLGDHSSNSDAGNTPVGTPGEETSRLIIPGTVLNKNENLRGQGTGQGGQAGGGGQDGSTSVITGGTLVENVYFAQSGDEQGTREDSLLGTVNLRTTG